jgi:hypothetical protein
MDDPVIPAIQSHRRRWPAILSVVGLVAATVLAFLWFGLPPRVPTRPIRLVRGENGQMALADAPEQTSFISFEVHAGTIKAKNNFSSSSVSSHSDNSGFACARLAILNRSDHLLMARVGQSLLEELKPVALVREIAYYPAGFSPERGKLAPDVVITLDLDQLAEKSWPAWRSVEATFSVTAGNGPPGCRNSYTDHLTPPLAEFDWEGKLHHVSTTSGVSSSAAKYKLVAENVAKQIAGALTKEFRERLEKEGPLPDLPQAFYPAYREVPALPFGKLGILELVTSWHGVMNHNQTLWRLTTDRPAADILGEMYRRLAAMGWKGRDSSKAPGQNYLRMTHNDATIVAYRPSPQETPPSSSAKDLVLCISPSLSAKESVLYIQYVDRMTEGEMRAAIDEAIGKGAPTDILICFERLWSEDQSRRILQLLRSRPTRTPQASLALANLYHHRLKQDDRARSELLRASALLRTITQYSDLESRVRNLAKELGDEKLAERPIEPRVLEELGFIELKPGVQARSREIGVEEPVHFYVKTSKGSIKIISVRVIESTSAGSESYQLAYVDSIERGRSWGSGGKSHEFSVDDGRRATFTIDRVGTTARFRLSAQLFAR